MNHTQCFCTGYVRLKKGTNLFCLTDFSCTGNLQEISLAIWLHTPHTTPHFPKDHIFTPSDFCPLCRKTNTEINNSSVVIKIYGTRSIYGCSESVQARKKCKSEYAMPFSQRNTRKNSSHMSNTCMASLAKQKGTNFSLKTLSSYLVTALHWLSSKELAGVPAARVWFCRHLTGADGDGASHLLIISPCSPPHSPVMSGTCQNSH